MPVNKKLIYSSGNYDVFEIIYTNFELYFKVWRNNKVEVKFTDNFARANGYLHIKDMLAKIPGMKNDLIEACGEIPKWISVDKNLGFTVPITQSNVDYN